MFNKTFNLIPFVLNSTYFYYKSLFRVMTEFKYNVLINKITLINF